MKNRKRETETERKSIGHHMWDRKYREELERRRKVAAAGGGEKRVGNQHGKGKLTARERLNILFDEGSFVEMNTLTGPQDPQSVGFTSRTAHNRVPGDGVITGYGMVGGRMVCASAQDFTVIGGTLGEYHSRKICRIMDMALRMRVPYVSINDSGGARIEEGLRSLDGYSGIFYRNTKASGIIPQISVILGPCAGGACYSPAITDFIFMSRKTANMFITGPGVVKFVVGEEISAEELGGAEVHATKSGVVHFVYDDDRACLNGVRKLLSYLPGNCDERPTAVSVPEGKSRSPEAAPEINMLTGGSSEMGQLRGKPPEGVPSMMGMSPGGPSAGKPSATGRPSGSTPAFPEAAGDGSCKLEEIVSDNQRRPYDMKEMIRAIVDADSFFEVQEEFAKNIAVGFARLDGETVGIVGNNPKGGMAGSLDIDASEKAARFVRFCDCFNIPLLTLVDVPGFFPGREQEHGGIIRRGAKLLYAYAEATVPKVTLILRKAYGGAYIAMNSKGMGADLVFAWPIAETAVMGAEGAVGILYGKQIEASADPPAEKARLAAEYEERFMNPYIAAEEGYIDEVILPEETGERLRSAFAALRRKDRKAAGYRTHGNIPL